MEVRTYRGKGLKQLLSKVKQDLGRDCLILSTTELEGNEFELRVGVQKESPAIELTEVCAAASRTQRVIQHMWDGALASHLCEQGVSSDLTLSLLGRPGTAELSGEDLLTEGLSQAFPFDCGLADGPRVLAFVGTTGVGKTTTIAKLAAKMRAGFNVKIGLISADRYRVGAGHHLQSYAQMMNVKCITLSGKKIEDEALALRRALQEFRDMDLVFVDTAGCSPRELNRINALEESLNGIEGMEKILLLPAPSNECDLRMARRAFERLEPSRLILTKLDETGFIGPVLNIAHESGLPLAFFTAGQRVPEDIEPASARRLAWMLSRTMH